MFSISQQNQGPSHQKESSKFSPVHSPLQKRTQSLKHHMRYSSWGTIPFNTTSSSTFCHCKRAHCKSCNLRIKVNSSCNWNCIPPTQGHSLWTSHSPYSRLTLNMPYWTPLENNSSIGNFQGTDCEEIKSISLVAATHIICHSFKKQLSTSLFFPSFPWKPSS